MSMIKLSKKFSILSPKPFPPTFRSGPCFSSSSNKSLISPARNYSGGVVSSSALQYEKAKKMLRTLVGVAIGMVGLTYAAVPLYNTLCEWTGHGGTVRIRQTIEETVARSQERTAPTREIVVQFNADVADGMQWKFIPSQREVRVKPGESALAFYTAENRSSSPITGVSTYNVTPHKAGRYFNKIQCFCFEKQCLLPGEQIDMPVFFYIDPEIEADPTLKGVKNIILSYTFFEGYSYHQTHQTSQYLLNMGPLDFPW